MKKLSANVLAVDTKLLLKGSCSPGGPASIIAGPVNGQPGWGDSVPPAMGTDLQPWLTPERLTA